MPIPDYQTLMLPLLKFLSNGKELPMREDIEHLYKEFNLTNEERKTLLPSGQQAVFDNRVGWARTFLKKSGLVESPKRGYVKITSRGLEILKQNPAVINNDYLKKYPEFVEFLSGKPKQDKEKVKNEEITSEKTPEEMIEEGHQQITQSLAQDLLNQIKNNPPDFFEKLVVELLVKMGYGGS